MKTSHTSMIAVALACGAAGAAQALPLSDQTSVELFVGGNTVMPGSFHDGSSAPLDSAPGGDIAFDRVHFDSAYDNRYAAGAELDYAVDDRLTGFARAAYSQFDGRSRDVGSQITGEGRVPIGANFDDNHMRQLDLGARYTFAPGARLRPFVGLGLGAADLAATRATIDESGTATRVELAKGGTVFEQRVETGLQFSPLPNFDLRLTAAALHLGGQHASDDPNLDLLGISPSRSTVGSRWDYPAELGAVWHF
ncbi:MAG TPA: hypothetical protein VMF52_11260 [Steroidobacteraceae bacterium]|nr:hypothetical protein [Steroidobacteraceae bacterium]